MALQARAVHCGGQWLWPSGSALCKGLGNGPSSSSAPLPLSLYRPPGAAVDQPGPTGMPGSQQTPLPGSPPLASAPPLASEYNAAHLPRPRTQAGPVILLIQPAGRLGGVCGQA